MKIGDLVTMDYSDWPDGDEWGVGVVMEIDKSKFYNSIGVAIHWSKIGLSWEETATLEIISASR